MGHLVRQHAQIDAMLYAEIQTRQTQPELLGGDILSLMLTAQDGPD